MRVAILSDKLVVSGGAERYLANMIDALLAGGDSVDLYTTKVSFDKNFLAQKGLRVHCRNLSWCPRKLRHIFFERYLKNKLARASYDLVLGLATPYAPSIAICFGTFLGSMRTSAKHRLCNPLNWVRVHYEAKKYRGAQCVVVRSHAQKSEVCRLFNIDSDKVSVLPPPITGFDMSSAPPEGQDAQTIRKHFQLEDGIKHFIFVSNNHRRKGLHTILKAFDMLKRDDCRLLVVGAPQGRFPPKSSDKSYIKWLGYIDDKATLRDLYQVCDGALLLSHYEPFGQTVAEALLSGLPVFISDRVGASDIVSAGHSDTHKYGWVVPCGDAGKLASAIASFLEKPARTPQDSVDRLRERLSIERHIAALKGLKTPN